jgi:hypothetical protein
MTSPNGPAQPHEEWRPGQESATPPSLVVDVRGERVNLPPPINYVQLAITAKATRKSLFQPKGALNDFDNFPMEHLKEGVPPADADMAVGNFKKAVRTYFHAQHDVAIAGPHMNRSQMEKHLKMQELDLTEKLKVIDKCGYEISEQDQEAIVRTVVETARNVYKDAITARDLHSKAAAASIPAK